MYVSEFAGVHIFQIQYHHLRVKRRHIMNNFLLQFPSAVFFSLNIKGILSRPAKREMLKDLIAIDQHLTLSVYLSRVFNFCFSTP